MTPEPWLCGVFTSPDFVPLITQAAVPPSGRGPKGPSLKLETRHALSRWTWGAGQMSLLFFKGGTRGEKKIRRYLSIKEKLLFGKVFFFFSLKYNGKLTRYWSLVSSSKMEAQKQETCHIKCVRPKFSKRMFSQGALQVSQELDLHLFLLPCAIFSWATETVLFSFFLSPLPPLSDFLFPFLFFPPFYKRLLFFMRV